MDYRSRLAKLYQSIEGEGLDALLVSQPENIRYLSGFTSPDALLIISQKHACIVTDSRYYEQAAQQAPDFELVKVTRRVHEALAGHIAALGFRTLGFESHAVTVQTYTLWKRVLPDIEWVASRDLVERLRLIKDTDEITAIKEAVRIADDAMCHIIAWIRPGMTEREVAWELEVHMRTHGGERLSFTTIVGSGPNGAMAHAVASDRPIAIGDPIVIDMGTVYDGYCSDMTRSFCLGHGSDKYRKVWDTVLEAQLAAENRIKAGVSGVEADAIARQIIYAAGYEGMFGHGLGHGVGLAIHEGPRASYTSKDTLKEDSIVTVEPGIYIPGWGGVRIEDMVLIGEDGCCVLTQAPKQAVVSVT